MVQVLPPVISKLSATGNDFLLVGLHRPDLAAAWQEAFGDRTRSDVARHLCDRHEGIGADGLLCFLPKDGFDFAWEFYNQDGSQAEMCGNAARCAGLWAARTVGSWRTFQFSTAAGPVAVRRLESGYLEVTMPRVEVRAEKLNLLVQTEKLRLAWIDSGVPHAVVRQESLRERDVLLSLARELRRHPQFGSKGTNVTFYTQQGPDHIATLTYERGVEDFTRACGTGAVAAAFELSRQTKTNQVEVVVPGGKLQVLFRDGRPLLSGPAHWIADCQLVRA